MCTPSLVSINTTLATLRGFGYFPKQGGGLPFGRLTGWSLSRAISARWTLRVFASGPCLLVIHRCRLDASFMSQCPWQHWDIQIRFDDDNSVCLLIHVAYRRTISFGTKSRRSVPRRFPRLPRADGPRDMLKDPLRGEEPSVMANRDEYRDHDSCAAPVCHWGFSSPSLCGQLLRLWRMGIFGSDP
jgi:hypothetical protein